MRILCSVFSASASKSPHNVRRFRSLFSAGRLIINVISSLQDGARGEIEHARYPSLAAEINLPQARAAQGPRADLARDSPGRTSGAGGYRRVDPLGCRLLFGARDAHGLFTSVALEEPVAHPSEEPGRQRAGGDR